MTQEQIDKLVSDTYNFDEECLPILDGIIDESKYLSGIPKILWILKEPYDKGDGFGGSNSRDDIKNNLASYFKIPTWKRIAYSSYGIINGMTYEKVKERTQIHEILNSIAYINVSKFPANTTSGNRWKYFENIFEKCEFVLLEQIKSYNPEVIIIGNITYLFLPAFDLTWEDKVLLPLMKKFYFLKPDKLIIDAYHPGVREKDISEADYCNAIISTAQDWLNNRKRVNV